MDNIYKVNDEFILASSKEEAKKLFQDYFKEPALSCTFKMAAKDAAVRVSITDYNTGHGIVMRM